MSVSERGNFHSIQDQSLDEVTSIEVDAERVSFVFESDAALDNVIELHAEPAGNAPSLARSGNRIKISQSGQYMADSTPVVRLPAGKLPGIYVNLDRGELAFELDEVETDIALNLDRGNVRISGSSGNTAINVDRGNVQVRDRTGDFACNIDRGNFALTGGAGNTAVNLDLGSATVTGSSGTLNLNVDKGDISILRPLEQAIKLSASNGNIEIRQGSVRSLTVETDRGNITSRTRLLPGAVDDEDPDIDDDIEAGGDIDETVDEALADADIDSIVDEALADAGISGESVHFNLGGISFEAGEEGVRIVRGDHEMFRASPEGVEIRGRDGKPIFAASDRGVSLRGRDIGGGGQLYQFSTDRGNVHVDIPDNLAARVELIVNRGRAESDIPLVEVNRPGPRGSTRRFVGVTDSSAPNRVLVRASTGRGNVEVRRRPLAPPTPPTPPAPPSAKGAAGRDARRRAVLDALSKGKISIEEAQTLISAIERET